MEVHFALVLDQNAEADPDHWRASAVAASRTALLLQHDGHVILIPRKPGDRRIEDVTAVHPETGGQDPAGVYHLA